MRQGRLLCATLLLLLARPSVCVLRGLPPTSDDAINLAVVGVWGKQGTVANATRCTGTFISPEVVLTAASCVLQGTPTGLFQHAACAHGAVSCPTVPADTLEIIAANRLPDTHERTAEVLSYEFRYSVPSLMPQVCTGGSACGEGWDIAALRVRQLCPRQRCIPPLPLSLGSLQAGETLRIVGAGIDPAAATLEEARHALRYQDGPLDRVRANQTLTIGAFARAALFGEPGPSACPGDDGAPIFRYEPTLDLTTGAGADGEMYGTSDVGLLAEIDALFAQDDAASFSSGASISTGTNTGSSTSYDAFADAASATGGAVSDRSADRSADLGGGGSGGGRSLSDAGFDSSGGLGGSGHGGWALVGVHSRIRGADSSGAGACVHSTTGSRAWLTRVSRCWLWRVLTLWRSLPRQMLPATPPPPPPSYSGMPAPPVPPISPDSVQWIERIGVRRLSARVLRECRGIDHWPPELRAPSRALPSVYSRQLADADEPVLPTLPPTPLPNQAGVCYGSPLHFCVHILSERGRLRYSIDDGSGSVVGRALHLTRLVTYTFQVVGVHQAHPLVISDSDTGPDRRRGVEVVGTFPAYGYDLFAFTPQAATPSLLYYQSTSRSGLGGPIHIANTKAAEPRSLPGADGTPFATPSVMILWDAHGVTVHRWSEYNESSNLTDSAWGDSLAGGAGGEDAAVVVRHRLDVIGHLPLATLARAAVYNRTYARWQREYAEAMRFAPVPPNITYTNVSNSTNVTLTYAPLLTSLDLVTCPAHPSPRCHVAGTCVTVWR